MAQSLGIFFLFGTYATGIDCPKCVLSWLVNWTLKKPTLWVLRSTGIVSLNSRAHILEGNYISLALLQQAADLVYAHAHQLSPLDSTFCLPVDKHKTCSYAIPHPMEISFISFCRKSGFIVEETNEMKKFLTEMQIEECVLVAQYLAHTNRAIYTPNVSLSYSYRLYIFMWLTKRATVCAFPIGSRNKRKRTSEYHYS
jgi:hypothetical protein